MPIQNNFEAGNEFTRNHILTHGGYIAYALPRHDNHTIVQKNCT